MVRIVIVAAAAIALAAPAAAQTAPTAHDQALVRQLVAQVNTFNDLSKSDNSDKELEQCAQFKGDPVKAFGAAFAALPAILIQLVNEYKPQFLALRSLLQSMNPDSDLFSTWAGAEAKSVDYLLRFDNGGKKIDLCRAAGVMLAKNTTAADIRDVLGVDPSLVAKLFTSQPAFNKTLDKLKPQMQAFFDAAGTTPKQAKALTS